MVDFLIRHDRLEMECPKAFGWFHLMCIGITMALIGWFIYRRAKGKMPSPGPVFAIYGITTLVLELMKQFMWAVGREGGVVVWDYSWYSAPFQFCTMPMYITLLWLIIPHKKVRNALECFLGFFSVISMALVMMIPGDVFTRNPVINVHTMVMHAGGLVVAIYVLLSKRVEFSVKSLLKGGIVFLSTAALALFMDILVVKLGLNHGETFNMFYISPYYDCTLPVLSDIYKVVPYPVFLLIYFVAFGLGALVVVSLCKGIRKIETKITPKIKNA